MAISNIKKHKLMCSAVARVNSGDASAKQAAIDTGLNYRAVLNAVAKSANDSAVKGMAPALMVGFGACG